MAPTVPASNSAKQSEDDSRNESSISSEELVASANEQSLDPIDLSGRVNPQPVNLIDEDVWEFVGINSQSNITSNVSSSPENQPENFELRSSPEPELNWAPSPPMFLIVDVRGNITDDESSSNHSVQNSQDSEKRPSELRMTTINEEEKKSNPSSQESNPYSDMDLLIPVREIPYDPNYESASIDDTTDEFSDVNDFRSEDDGEEIDEEEEEEEESAENNTGTSEEVPKESQTPESNFDASPNV